MLDREGKTPTAEIVAGKSQNDQAVLPVTVKNIQYVTNGIQSISLAIWKNEDQSDLQWLPMEMENHIWLRRQSYRFSSKKNVMLKNVITGFCCGCYQIDK